MKTQAILVLAALAAGGLVGARSCQAEAASPAAVAAAGTRIATAAPLAPAGEGADLAELAPGIPVDSLTQSQRLVLASVLQDEFCYCGCPHTLSGCLREHKSCKHAPRMAALAARLAGTGLGRGEILKVLTEYYASFEKPKRAALSVKDFGPPLGDPKAPISIVEFSDFGCPYCQALRPVLEKFVEERKERVKLFYKPYPLPNHERSMEAAETVEWAREKGIFWPMHDTLFTHPHELSNEDLVGYARQLGADGRDLEQALEAGRTKARVQASQSEARAAGVPGTPTLFFDGRRYVLPDYSPSGLELSLEDEEEWKKNGGWAKD